MHVVRLLLTSYLTLVAAVGQGMCCCSLTRVTTECPPAAVTQAAEHHDCCAHKSTAATEKRTPAGQQHHCPCRDQSTLQAATAPAVTLDLAGHDNLAFDQLFTLDMQSGQLAVTRSRHSDVCAELARDAVFASSVEMLRAYSIQRC